MVVNTAGAVARIAQVHNSNGGPKPPPAAAAACCSLGQNFPTLTISGHDEDHTKKQALRSLAQCSSQLSNDLGYVVDDDDNDGARPQSNVVEILEQRGLLDSLTSDALRSLCFYPSLPPLRVYCGFDPTSEILHLGNLLAIIVLSWFLRCGHQVVALVGTATASIGDPSARVLPRPDHLVPATLESNADAIATTIKSILGRVEAEAGLASSGSSFDILNNEDWLNDINLLSFFGQAGRSSRVETMISNDSVSDRLQSDQEGLDFAEFTYQLLQGYDFLHLFRSQGVSVQIGGSDQWGNIKAGIDLIRWILQSNEAYGLTFPLLLSSNGAKFGKSSEDSAAISLSSPYKLYQYLFSVADADVMRFLKMFTFLSMEEISQLERDMERPGYVPNTVQQRLANEVTRFVHGQEGLDEALKATEALRPGAQTKLDWNTIQGIAEDVPSCSLHYDHVLTTSLLDLSVATGLVASKSAARRLLKQGGLYLNNFRVESEAKKIEAEDIIDGKVILLSAGKKNKLVVRVS